jgi:AraC family transcriptional regulator
MKGAAMTEAATGWPSSNEIVDVSTLVAELLAIATEALDRDRETARRCIAHAAAVVERIGRRPQPGECATSQGGLAPWQVRRVRTYIDANLSARITLNELSEVARLSTSHFSRAFKRSFGMAPYAFVLRRRMEYAQRLMLTSESPLCQIALECGLSDQSHFSRLFQRTMGTNPNEWRRFCRVERQGASVS